MRGCSDEGASQSCTYHIAASACPLLPMQSCTLAEMHLPGARTMGTPQLHRHDLTGQDGSRPNLCMRRFAITASRSLAWRQPIRASSARWHGSAAAPIVTLTSATARAARHVASPGPACSQSGPSLPPGLRSSARHATALPNTQLLRRQQMPGACLPTIRLLCMPSCQLVQLHDCSRGLSWHHASRTLLRSDEMH